MAEKKNPLKLNKLQCRTLALLQVLAREETLTRPEGTSGDITILSVPQPHGDHMHIGKFVVSSRDASGLSNKNVWSALDRKGLVRRDDPLTITLTAAGVSYRTGLEDRFIEESDH